MADPKSIHPEASYHARLPMNDTNAYLRWALHPSSGLPQEVDSALDCTVLRTCISCGVLFRFVFPSSTRWTFCSHSCRLPHGMGPQDRRPFEPEPKGRLLDLASRHHEHPLGMTGVLSARSGRQEVAVFRGTGFGSAPRRWGRHIGVCDAGPTVSVVRGSTGRSPTGRDDGAG